MPSPDSLLQLIARGEGEHLEFKKTLTHPHKLARTLAAFANTRGGVVLVGVLDDGCLCGVRDAPKECAALAQAVALTDPPVALHLEEIELPGAAAEPEEIIVLRATVPESARKPHCARLPTGERRAYVRAGAETVPASALMQKVLRHDDTPQERAPTRPLSRHEAAVLALVPPVTGAGQRAPRLTEAQVARHLNFSPRRARQLLLGLTLDGLLVRHDREGTPFWTRLG